jgi:hypothetical protein
MTQEIPIASRLVATAASGQVNIRRSGRSPEIRRWLSLQAPPLINLFNCTYGC